MIFLLKLILTPFLIGSVTLAGRRWGPVVSGLLMGMPLTSGPVSLFLALEYGPIFAAHAAIGNIVGQASVCVFCFVYSRISRKCGWQMSVTLSALAFLVATAIWNSISWSLLVAYFVVVIVIGLVIWLMPKPTIALIAPAPPKWDLPARIGIATAFVVTMTAIADELGPQLSGLLTPFPVFGLVISAFTHHQQGPDAATKLQRGILMGLLASATFLLIVGLLLPILAIGWTYLLASIAAIGLSGLSFYWSHRDAKNAAQA
ncbi:hypothetical protein HY229_01260 [Candidatus Acetothermia bacterium]|nr:hypothetical protein [Candidatus Acetothermia bacterium]MBI3642717.1 hypothetical protein [Candidatus Acetothermia bacterium]